MECLVRKLIDVYFELSLRDKTRQGRRPVGVK